MLVAPLVALIAAAVAKRRKVGIGVFLIYLALGAWGLGVVAVTLFPLPYQHELIESERSSQFLGNNLVPLATIGPVIREGLDGSQLRVLVANVVMFVPFGFFAALLPTRRPTALRVVMAAIVTSCAIELTQWLISSWLGYTYRTADIDDVILNTLGAALGFIAFRLAGPSVELVLGRHDGGRTPIEEPGTH